MINKTVYCVLSGEKHEGGSLMTVHETREGAVKYALETPCHFDGGWKQILEEDPAGTYWENGCDFVEIVERIIDR